ncbi:MAG: hypothetical protein JWP97_797 [Labilithrix sp.]|nr:hypothetical protein [Labilithrix sp.]
MVPLLPLLDELLVLPLLDELLVLPPLVLPLLDELLVLPGQKVPDVASQVAARPAHVPLTHAAASQSSPVLAHEQHVGAQSA